MALVRALNSAVVGLKAQQTLVDVTGSNLANATTPGYKGSRVNFQTMLNQTISFGSAPVGGGLGGTNPVQIGLGGEVADVTRQHTQGELENTGVNTDLAINGDGFFRLNSTGIGAATKTILYTRDGSFGLSAPVDHDNNTTTPTRTFLINPTNGFLVQGINANLTTFAINTATPPDDIYIPIGLGVSRATTSLDLAGNLNGGGTAATLGTILRSGVLGEDTNADGVGDISATGGTLLTNLASGFGAGSTDLQIVAGDVITLTATKGGRAISETLTVGAADNVTALMTFINQSLGIVDAVAPATAGVALGGVGVNQIQVTGNNGTANGITSLTLANTGTTAAPKSVSFPVFTTTQSANGESGSTDTVVFDSTGIPHTVTMSFVLETAAAAGNTWRYYVESAETTDRQVSTGAVTFNAAGQLATGITSAITLPTTIPVTFNVGLTSVTDFGSSASSIFLSSQNGFEFGTLDNFSIGEDGKVTGIFSNGITRDVAQIQLAKFSNPAGLEAIDANNFKVTASAGTEARALPKQNGAGSIVSGALESSNVDVAQEFTNLIIGQRAFQANARVISVTDAMLQDLIQTI